MTTDQTAIGCCSPATTAIAVDPTVPVACSLDRAALSSRADEWAAVLAHVAGRQPIAGGLRLTLDDDGPVADVARLAAAEQACCPFFGFAITVDSRGTAIEVVAPEEGRGVLDALFGAGTTDLEASLHDTTPTSV